MPFVKLDCGLLDSTLWIDRDAREIFITALMMAQPHELHTPMPEIATRTADETGWIVPGGWYGFVAAAGVGIVRRAGLDEELGMAALERLASPEADSRSREFDGRRLVRVNGGFIVLNFMRFRDRDYTAADRSRRYRDRQRKRETTTASRRSVTASRVSVTRVTQAEAEADAYKIPKKTLDTLHPKKWLQPFGKAWQLRCGESVPWDRLEACLFPLCEKFKCTPVLNAFRGYLNKTEPRYCSPARFAATSAQWGLGNGGAPNGPRYPTADEADRAAGIPVPPKS